MPWARIAQFSDHFTPSFGEYLNEANWPSAIVRFRPKLGRVRNIGHLSHDKLKGSLVWHIES
jgi:hypothetical protein